MLHTKIQIFMGGGKSNIDTQYGNAMIAERCVLFIIPTMSQKNKLIDSANTLQVCTDFQYK